MRWGSFDFSDFRAMAARLDRALAENHSEQMIREVLQELGALALRRVKRKTPLVTGNLRRNWFITNVERRGDDYLITVYNNAGYAPFVENGHRIVTKSGATVGYVEGRYMLRISMGEVERAMPRIIQTHTHDILARIFGD